MAYIAGLDTDNKVAEELAEALDKIRDGMATIKKFEHLRAASIGESLDIFETIFGITQNGQAFSDRMTAVNAGTGTQAALMEFSNEIVAVSGGYTDPT